MKSRVRWIAVFLVLLLVSIASVGQTPSVHFIDVGQGDAILIDYGEYELLIDGGRGRACSLYLRTSGCIDGALDVIVATHMDADHIGGLDEVFDDFVVDELWINGNSAATDAYEDFRNAYLKEGCTVQVARRNDSIQLGDIELTVLHPRVVLSDRNKNSVVLLLSILGWDFLFTGDIDKGVEEELLSMGLLRDVDVVKIAHHGSDKSTGESFLRATTPQVCVISVGASNRYDHPSSDVLNQIACNLDDYLLFRTDKHGTVVLSVDESGQCHYKTEYGVDPIVEECSSLPPPSTSAPLQLQRTRSQLQRIVGGEAVFALLLSVSLDPGRGY